MPPRPKFIVVSDVEPPVLRTTNRDALVQRLRDYHMWHRRGVGVWEQHPNSRVGDYTYRVNRINLADTNLKVRNRYDRLKSDWGELWGIEFR